MRALPGRPIVVLSALIAAVGLSCPQTPEWVIRGTEHAAELNPVPSTVALATQTEELTPVEPQDPEPSEPVEPAELSDPAEPNEVTTTADPSETDEGEGDDEPVASVVADAGVDAAVANVEEPTAGKNHQALAAIRKEVWVFAKPAWNARKIGYLRAGAVVGRDARPAGFKGCKAGWYRIEPKGFVCVGKNASLNPHHAVVEAAGVRPDRNAGLPYAYAMSNFPPPPFYVRLPSEEEQREVEPDLVKHLRQKRDMTSYEALAGPVPGALLYERGMPSIEGGPRGPQTLYTGRPVARSGYGLLSVFSWTDRLFGVTTDLGVVPLDRTRMITPSTMRGVHLEESLGLPVAFVRSKAARRYLIDPETNAVQDAGEVGYREGFALTGRRLRVGGNVYLETRSGVFIQQNDRVVILPAINNVPGWAKKGRKWIDVSILRQSLVAYEGTRPVFATLVSTGADGLGDPKETHSTVRGAFVIHTKHVTVTMDGDEPGDVYDLRDVPYVQYFMDGYALHGAYWHDEFGTPRSHGCINLSPADAAWLFAWTDPEVPEGWHARLQLHGGTLVYTHP